MPEQLSKECRRFKREPLPLHVVVSVSGRSTEYFTARDVSGKGVAIFGEIEEAIGEEVEVRVYCVGGGTARVVRKGNNETAFEFVNVNVELQDRRMRWHASTASDHRRHPRIRPCANADETVVTPVVMPDGTALEVIVYDLSAGGVKVGLLNVALGDRLRVAEQIGSVIRIEEDAVVIAFDLVTRVRKLRIHPHVESNVRIFRAYPMAAP
jgi:hypothetical protein